MRSEAREGGGVTGLSPKRKVSSSRATCALRTHCRESQPACGSSNRFVVAVVAVVAAVAVSVAGAAGAAGAAAHAAAEAAEARNSVSRMSGVE